MSCQVHSENMWVYLMYDIDRHMIIQTSATIDDLTVGKLILAWGVPTGMRRAGDIIQVQWGTRSVYVSSNSLNPSTPTSSIFYSLMQTDGMPWMGFGNRHNES